MSPTSILLSRTDWLDIAGTALVFFGVVGGYIVARKKTLPEPSVDELETVRFNKFSAISRRKIWSDVWECLLILGLALEVSVLPYHISEAARMNRDAADARKDAGDAIKQATITESNNLVLRTKLVALETKVRDRKLNYSVGVKLLECLRESPKGFVWVASDTAADPTAMKESREYAQQIAGVMTAAGFEQTKNGTLSLASIGAPGVFLLVDDATSPPPHSLLIQRCLRENGILPADIQSSRFVKEFGESNVLLIFVSTKP